MTQRLVIEGRLPGLNDVLRVRGRNHYAWNKVKKRHEEEIAWEIKAAGLRPVEGPCRLSFLWVEQNRRRDPDNVAAGGRKMILDALVTMGILADDGWKQVHGWTDAWDVDKENPRI